MATILGMSITFTPIDPFKALYWSAVINGVVAAPVMGDDADDGAAARDGKVHYNGIAAMARMDVYGCDGSLRASDDRGLVWLSCQ
jgi:hypothetical protein